MPHLHAQLLATAGRLLLEYNESTGEIYRTLGETACALEDDECEVAVAYGEIAVELPGDTPLLVRVPELLYNAALLARIHSILDGVRSGKLDPSAALAQ